MAVPSYAFVALVTIPTTNIDATLTNYPVMVKIVSTDATLSGFLTALSSGSGVTANRKKISVQTLANAECYVDIVYTSSTDFYFWVKIPSVSHSSATQFYVCADASKSENTTYVGDTGSSAAQNVWTGYHAVYNYNQTPSAGGTITDATGNGRSLTITSTPSAVPVLWTSPVGRSYAYNYSADMARTTDSSMNLEGDIWSCEALLKAGSQYDDDYIVGQLWQNGCSFYKRHDDIVIVHQKSTGNEVSLTQADITGYTDWKYYGCNVDADLDYTAWAAYYGSTKYTSATMTNGTGTRYSFSGFWVGKVGESATSYFGHLRVSNGANKTDAWHKANHYNFSNSLFTATIAGITVYPSDALTQTISIPGGEASYSTSYAQAAALTQARTINDATITTATNPFNAPLLTLRKTLITGTRLANIGRFAVNFSSKRPNVEFRIRE